MSGCSAGYFSPRDGKYIMQNTDAMYYSKSNYKLPIIHLVSTYLIIYFLLL